MWRGDILIQDLSQKNKINDFKKNEIVYYLSNNKLNIVSILDVHFNDGEPYYTIVIENKERSTIGEKLRRIVH